MKKAALAVLATLALTVSASAEIRGSYIETRNAEIYASHCFANAEAGIRGDIAAMAWKIDVGSYEGVSLDGLGVVALVKASATIGDPFGNPLPTKTMFLFDEKASDTQKKALEAMAVKAAGGLIAEVVNREAAPISLDFKGSMHDRVATLHAGNLVKLETRAIEDSDSLCHLDSIYYQPLIALDHAMAAHSVTQKFHSSSLDVNLDEYRRSSVWMGTFALAGAEVSD